MRTRLKWQTSVSCIFFFFYFLKITRHNYGLHFFLISHFWCHLFSSEYIFVWCEAKKNQTSYSQFGLSCLCLESCPPCHSSGRENIFSIVYRVLYILGWFYGVNPLAYISKRIKKAYISKWLSTLLEPEYRHRVCVYSFR